VLRAGLAAAVVALVLAGCGSDPTGSAGETPYDFSFDDPVGDTTVATANPDSVAAIDLVGVSGRVDADRIELILEFAEPVSRWSDGGGNALDGFVFFDTDQATGTGKASGGTPATTGAEFYLDLRDDGSGRLGLVNFGKKTISVLTPTFSGTRLEIRIPRAQLATTSDTDAKLNVAVEIGVRGRAPVSDRGGNGAAYVLEPPA